MKILIFAATAALAAGSAHAQVVSAPSLPRPVPSAPSVGADVGAEARVDAQANAMRGRTRDPAPSAPSVPAAPTAAGGGQQAPATENGTAPTTEPNGAVPDVPQQRPQQDTRTPADPAPGR